MPQPLNLLIFRKTETRQMLESLGVAVDAAGRATTNGEPRGCNSCEDDLTVATFGAALPGSVLLYCDRPACLAEYVQRKLEPQAQRTPKPLRLPSTPFS